jgi:hypothetical protein
MAEATVTRISDAVDLPQNEATFPLQGADYLNAKLQDAERLLTYAAETGIEVKSDVRDTVLEARKSASKWDGKTAANLLGALTTLAATLKPVTAESLKLCAEESIVDKTVRTYKRVAIVLAVFIIPYSIATFVTSAISEAIRKDIDTANALAVKLSDELPPQAQSTSDNERVHVKALPRGVTESDIIRDLQSFTATLRSIDARARQLNIFTVPKVSDPFADRRDNPDFLRQLFELPPGLSNLYEATIEKFQVYQDERLFAQGTRETASVIYGAIAACILPVLYALLGACAYLLRLFEVQIRLRTFTLSDAHIARFVIAAIGGGVVGLFNNFNISQDASIPPLAIAFMVGYAVDVFFSFLEGLLQTFTRRGAAASQTESAAKS